jgi:hypothetical protein
MSTTEKAQEIQAEEPQSSSTAAELKRSITIDTLHNDEAVKVLANYTGPETWDQKEEKRLVKHIDRRLLPILCTTYGIVSAIILRLCITVPDHLPRTPFLRVWPELSPLLPILYALVLCFGLHEEQGRQSRLSVMSWNAFVLKGPHNLRQSHR